jgi:hypothetical protein
MNCKQGSGTVIGYLPKCRGQGPGSMGVAKGQEVWVYPGVRQEL